MRLSTKITSQQNRQFTVVIWQACCSSYCWGFSMWWELNSTHCNRHLQVLTTKNLKTSLFYEYSKHTSIYHHKRRDPLHTRSKSCSSRESSCSQARSVIKQKKCGKSCQATLSNFSSGVFSLLAHTMPLSLIQTRGPTQTRKECELWACHAPLIAQFSDLKIDRIKKFPLSWFCSTHFVDKKSSQKNH